MAETRCRIDTEAAGASPGRRPLASRPEFYLVYLLFYFIPWAFRRPSAIDILVAVLAILAFLPIYFRAYEKTSPRYISHLLLMEGLAFATAPFHGMNGVFHIYASVQAGFQRPGRNAALLLIGLAAAFLTLSLALGTRLMDMGMSLFIGAVTGIICMWDAEKCEQLTIMRRSRALDRQLAALSERERIARDLHDLLGHTLTMVALKAELAGKLLEADTARARQEITDICEASRSALKDVRRAVADMNVTTVETEIAQAREVLSAASIAFEVSGAVPRLDARHSKALGLAIREAVTNVVRHSEASRAALLFAGGDDQLVVTIEDDGRGGIFREGSGLAGLRRRIESLGGQTDIVTGTDRGTSITFRLPHIGGMAQGSVQ